MQKRGERLLLGAGQRRQERPDGGKAFLEEFLAKRHAPLAGVERDCPFILSFATLNEAVCDKPINEADCSRMGQAKNAPQLIVGRAAAISDNDKRRGRLTGVTEDIPRPVLDEIGDSESHNTEQIGSTVDHPWEGMCGAHILQLDNMCIAHVSEIMCVTCILESVTERLPHGAS